jgi:rhodanese-related sulfurtransferase/polyisoprenoid-binding protein YceI
VTNATNCKQMSPKELDQWITENREFCLIDILPNAHFCSVHLPDSENACVFEVNFVDQIKNIVPDKEKQIVLYGASHRSMDALKASEKLEMEGYKNCIVLKGGLEDWKARGLALEGDAINKQSDPQTTLQLEEGSYKVNTDQSTIQWTGRNPFSTHYGNIKISEGELAVNNKIITGTFSIDMNSITNINLEGDESQPVLIDHLKSDDFFWTAIFPSAGFRIKNSIPVKEPSLTAPNYEIMGELELRGLKAEQNFMATITRTPENGLAAEAHFDIDRTRWNIIYGSTRFFEHLGMHQVFDLISIQVRIITL